MGIRIALQCKYIYCTYLPTKILCCIAFRMYITVQYCIYLVEQNALFLSAFTILTLLYYAYLQYGRKHEILIESHTIRIMSIKYSFYLSKQPSTWVPT